MGRKRSIKIRKGSATENPSDDTPVDADTIPAEDSKSKFLAARQFGVSAAEAARWAGIPRTTLYRWRRTDLDFAHAWLHPDDYDNVAQRLQFEAFKRAIHGNDRLLIFLLKSFFPDTFNERRRSKLLDRESNEDTFRALMGMLRQNEEPPEDGDTSFDEDCDTPSDSHEPCDDSSHEQIPDQSAAPVFQPGPCYPNGEDSHPPETLQVAHHGATHRPSIHI